MEIHKAVRGSGRSLEHMSQYQHLPRLFNRESHQWESRVLNGAVCRWSRKIQTRLRESFPRLAWAVSWVSLCLCFCAAAVVWMHPRNPQKSIRAFFWIQKEVGPREKVGTRQVGRKDRWEQEPHHTLSLRCSCKYWGISNLMWGQNHRWPLGKQGRREQ